MLRLYCVNSRTDADSSFSELSENMHTKGALASPQVVISQVMPADNHNIVPDGPGGLASSSQQHSKRHPAQHQKQHVQQPQPLLDTPLHPSQIPTHNVFRTPAQDPSARQLWPRLEPAEPQASADLAAQTPQAASPPHQGNSERFDRPSRSLDTGDKLSVQSDASSAAGDPPLTPLRDISEAELGRLLAHIADLRHRLVASSAVNRAAARDTHSMWRQLQEAQTALAQQRRATAEQTEHKALLLQFLRGSKGEEGGSEDPKFALDALRGTALRTARQQLDRTCAELQQSQQRNQALRRLAQRQTQVHEAERAALLQELRSSSEQMAHVTFIRRDEGRTAAAKLEQSEARRSGLEADFKSVLARAAQAEAFSSTATADLEHMQERISEKNTALDELSRELRITNEALGIVKGALRARTDELLAARTRCEELQRTIDATSSGDVANLVSASSKAASLVQVRYEAESARLRREVTHLRSQLRDTQLTHSTVVATAQSNAEVAHLVATTACIGAQGGLVLSPPLAAVLVPGESQVEHMVSGSTQTVPSSKLFSVGHTGGTNLPPVAVSSPVHTLQDSGPTNVFHMNSEQRVHVPASSPTQDKHAQTHKSGIADATSVSVGTQAELFKPMQAAPVSTGTQTDEQGDSTAPLQQQLTAAAEQQQQQGQQDRALARAAVIVEALEAQLDEAAADTAEARKARSRAQHELKGVSAERERASALAMDLAVEVAQTTASEEQARGELRAAKQKLQAARTQEVFLRLSWAALVRKAGAVATAASTEVQRLRGELEYAQEVNASLVSESATGTRTLTAHPVGTPLREKSRAPPPTAVAPRLAAADWVAMSSMLEAVSLDGSDSEGGTSDMDDFKPTSRFSGPMALPVGPPSTAAAATVDSHALDAWARALGHADSVSARNTALRRQAKQLQALTARPGMFGTPPRAAQSAPPSDSANTSWRTAHTEPSTTD